MSDQVQAPQPPEEPAATTNDAIAPPPGTPAAFDRMDWVCFGSTTLLALSVYLFTLAPNVTMGFSGLMSTAAMYFGVPHPPGYPVWTLYSWLWTKLLPFSNVAWRVAVGSAVAAAASCGLVAMMVSHQGKTLLGPTQIFERFKPGELFALRAVSGGVAGLVLGFSGAVWHEAVIADIWALSLLLFTGVVFLLVRWMREPGRRRYLYGAFLFFGLLLTSNQELIVIMPSLACFVVFVSPRLGRDVCIIALPLSLALTSRSQFGMWLDPHFEYINWPLLVAFLVVGLLAVVIVIRTRAIGSEWQAALLGCLSLVLGVSLYLLVPVAAMTNPPVNHGYARVAEGFEHLLARGQYERVRPTADFYSFLKQLLLYIRVAGREFGWFQLLLALPPFAVLRRLDPMNRRWLLGLLAMFIGVGPLLLAMLNPPSDVQAITLIKPYFAVSYAVVSLRFGFGILLIGGSLARQGEK
jgi:hypothetical protein